MVLITIVTGACKSTYNWGASLTLYVLCPISATSIDTLYSPESTMVTVPMETAKSTNYIYICMPPGYSAINVKMPEYARL